MQGKLNLGSPGKVGQSNSVDVSVGKFQTTTIPPVPSGAQLPHQIPGTTVDCPSLSVVIHVLAEIPGGWMISVTTLGGAEVIVDATVASGMPLVVIAGAGINGGSDEVWLLTLDAPEGPSDVVSVVLGGVPTLRVAEPKSVASEEA